MNKNTKSAVYLSFSGELKKVSYAVGAIMVANHVFAWFEFEFFHGRYEERKNAWPEST